MTIADTCRSCGVTVGRDRHACTACPQCGGHKSATAVRCYTCAWPGREPRHSRNYAEPAERIVAPEPIEPARATTRVKSKYRVYCVACGRSTEVEIAVSAPRRSRCQTCGGTMLLEPSE